MAEKTSKPGRTPRGDKTARCSRGLLENLSGGFWGKREDKAEEFRSALSGVVEVGDD
ncbi:MAG: hypothetical protein ACOYIK_08165 [Coriobacteriales bacterium]